MNNYAIEQGYENWDYLTFEISAFFLKEHINKVIDLIQNELKKKIAKNVPPEFLYEHESNLHIGYRSAANVTEEWNDYIANILNTENL
ncbi:hypothetical protein [Chishuiella sp.]|uniref:hypothetical protein n=1 Tax=Chishuiella sp. TaxID=1969467 RepID=UPI0028ABF4EB|nr:hypothetical protein [Chishuiella sp.]